MYSVLAMYIIMLKCANLSHVCVCVCMYVCFVCTAHSAIRGRAKKKICTASRRKGEQQADSGGQQLEGRGGREIKERWREGYERSKKTESLGGYSSLLTLATSRFSSYNRY